VPTGFGGWAPLNSYLVTVFSGVVVLVLVLVVLGYVLSVVRRLARYRGLAEQSARLVDIELERRYEQLQPFLTAAESADLSGDLLRQLAGALPPRTLCPPPSTRFSTTPKRAAVSSATGRSRGRPAT
jgi:LemA protein